MPRKMLLAVAAVCAIASSACAQKQKNVEAQAQTQRKSQLDHVTHVRAPFVNVDIEHDKHGKHRVSVQAPFTDVEKPANSDQAQVQVGQPQEPTEVNQQR